MLVWIHSEHWETRSIFYPIYLHFLGNQAEPKIKIDRTRSWRQIQQRRITSRPVWWEEDEDGDGLEEVSLSTESATGIRSSRSRSLSLVAITIDDDFSSPIASRPQNTTPFSSSTVNAAGENVKIDPPEIRIPFFPPNLVIFLWFDGFE